MSQRIPVGMPRVLFSLLMGDGTGGGILGDDLTAGSGSGAYQSAYAKAADYSFADAQLIQQTGGGRRILNVAGSDRPAEPFNITFGVLDSTLMALATAGAIDTRNSQFSKFGHNSALVELPAMFVAVQQYFYDPSRTGTARKYYLTDVYPTVTVEPKQGARGESSAVDIVYQVKPNRTTVDITGETFDEDLGMLPADGLVDFYQIETTNPIHFYTFITSGTVAQSLTKPFLPLSTTVTINATPNAAWVDGTAFALTSISTSTGVAAFTTGTTAQTVFLQYETNYQTA